MSAARYPGRARKPPAETIGMFNGEDLVFGSENEDYESDDSSVPIGENKRNKESRTVKLGGGKAPVKSPVKGKGKDKGKVAAAKKGKGKKAATEKKGKKRKASDNAEDVAPAVKKKQKAKKGDSGIQISLLSVWGKEDNDAVAAEAHKPKKSGKSRGADQSKVLGEVRAKPASNAAPRKVQPRVQGKGRYRLGGVRVSDLADGVQGAKDRINDFPNHSLTRMGKQLFCTACNTNLSTKKSVVKKHVETSTKHKKNLEALVKGRSAMLHIEELLEEYDEEHDPEGQALAPAVRIHRVDVTTTLLTAGIPVEKVACGPFRRMLERAGPRIEGGSLSSPSHLLELIPVCRELELRRLKAEMKGKHYTLVDDGTTRVCEVYCAVGRFWADRRVQQRVVGLRLLKHALTGPENAGFLYDVNAQFGGNWDNFLAKGSDKAAPNIAAFDIVKARAPNSFHIPCLSHTLSGSGEKHQLVLVAALVKALSSTQTSTNATECFKDKFEETMVKHQNVRWYVEYEQAYQPFRNFPALLKWLTECEGQGHAPESIASLRAVVTQHGPTLKLELNMGVDALDVFVRRCYELEGDGLLAFRTYDALMEVVEHIAAVRQGGAGCPNTRAVARSIVAESFPAALAVDNEVRVNALIQEQLVKVEPVFAYFMRKVIEEMADLVGIFKACRLFDPYRIDMLGANVADVEAQLVLLPFISPDERAQLLLQLPIYRAAAIGDGLTADCDREEWWAVREHTAATSAWFNGAIKVMILQPSSAACERVFSMLKAIMGEQQQSRAKEDYQEAAIMTRYNQLQRGNA
jgi:hypothetical protein